MGIFSSKGLTLVELIIVILIIGILSSIAIVQYNQYKLHSMKALLISDLRNCITSIAAAKQSNLNNIECVSSNGVTLSIISLENPITISATYASLNITCQYNESTGYIICNQ